MSDPASAGGIRQLWDEFQQGSGDIRNRIGMDAFGLGFAWPAARPGLYNYTAAAQVASLDHIPAGWRGRRIDAHDYAVFTHPGKLDTIGRTVDFVFNRWLRQPGVTRASSPDFELYDDSATKGTS